VAFVSFAAYIVQRSAASASLARDFAEAIALLERSGSQNAAIVDGTPIPVSKVKAYMVFQSTGRKTGKTMFLTVRTPYVLPYMHEEDERLPQRRGR
jgi:hypothetical protein